MSKHLLKAINILGSQSELARVLGVRQSVVHYWLNESKRGVPAEYCNPIEKATGGAVKASQLRPDLWGK